MVESLKELNKICQKPRYKEVGNWMVRNILRDAALPITWLLLHTSVTANQVTLFSLILGLAGISFFMLPGAGWFLAGALFLQIWYLLDHVDGQIARYRKTASMTGRFFDFVMHHILHGALLFPLGYYAYFRTKDELFILWGFAAAFSMTVFNMLYDVQYKTYFEKLSQMKSVEIMQPSPLPSPATQERGKRSERHFFSLLHKACEMHVMMNVLTGAALLEFFLLKTVDTRFFLFLFYGLAAPCIAIVKISYWIKTKKIDQEFYHSYQERPNT